MTTVVISQPMYFPWAGFLGQLARADALIWLDDAQFSKGSFTNRVQVRTASSNVWMSIPLSGRGSFQPIAELAATDERWRISHRDLLLQQLKGAPFLADALSVFQSAIGREALVDVLIASAEEMARYAGVTPTTVLRSSAMGVTGSSSQRVLDLALSVGADLYLTGHGAARYLDHALFERAGVTVEYMCYDVVAWPQRFDGFVPFVTGLDLLAHTGRDACRHWGGESEPWRRFLERKRQV